MNAPCSGAICIIEMPPSSDVRSISDCCTSSGGVPCATRYWWISGVRLKDFGWSAMSRRLPTLEPDHAGPHEHFAHPRNTRDHRGPRPVARLDARPLELRMRVEATDRVAAVDRIEVLADVV